MTNLNEIIEKTIYDVDNTRDNLSDCKKQMGVTVSELNNILKGTGFKICYGEFISEENKDKMFLTIVKVVNNKVENIVSKF